ncbi:prephenate dehydrogenase [Calidifontibacter terrae]
MRVHIIGCGLIGTSIGLALSAAGYDVSLEDPSPTAVAIARDLRAGRIAADSESVDLVVVAAPPDVVASVVVGALERHPGAVVTDVASVKQTVLDDVRASGSAHLARYVGSHPMAGRERSGAVAARGDLFDGRTWVICAGEGNDAADVAAVRRMAEATGAAVVQMPADEHDDAVAVVSHVPQIAASLVAARLRELPTAAVGLAGQGVRDVTRIAESDPLLWTQILAGNAAAITPVIDALADDVLQVRDALRALAAGDADGARRVLARTIADGQIGHARIPGKHGGAPTAYAILVVVLPDEPGTLGRLFTDVGAAGVNLEDMRLEHGAGVPVGLAELSVLPAAAEHLREELSAKGWRVHE